MTSLAGANLLLACSAPGTTHTPVAMDTASGRPVAAGAAADTVPSPEWVALDSLPTDLVFRMPYADTGNFTHHRIYDCARCLLRPEAAAALLKADKAAKNKGLRLLVFDCYRPRPYQQRMFDLVRDPRYVADPKKGSMHNRGCAVDLSLAGADGREVDMGSAFDDFSPRSRFGSDGLSREQAAGRTMLRAIMEEAGFKPYENEWWHFNYPGCDYPVSDLLWTCPQ